jgi:hypothetical protein
VYQEGFTFANGGCTTFPPLGEYMGQGASSFVNQTDDYPYESGQQPALGSGINTSDTVNWPIQTYVIDNDRMVEPFYASASISQFNINDLETRVTIQRGGTLTNISGFERCGLPMLQTTYRMWIVTTEMNGQGTVVNQVIAPDADAQYITSNAAMQFSSEFQNNPGTFTVQYWDFAYMTESNQVWTPASTLMTTSVYDGSGQDYGVHVVSVNGQDRVEFSNVPGNSYLPGNLPFSIAFP